MQERPADAVPQVLEGTIRRPEPQPVALAGAPEVAASNANFVKAISRQFNMEHLAPTVPAGSRKSLDAKSAHAPTTQACPQSPQTWALSVPDCDVASPQDSPRHWEAPF